MLRNLIALSLLLFMLSGCKLLMVVPDGGSVSSASGVNNCAENTHCEIEVTGPDFDEVFVALPRDGYKFVQWSHDSVCTDKQNPVCTASNVGVAGIPEAIAIINSDAEYFLRPIFTTTNSGQVKRRVVRDAAGVLVGEAVDIRWTDSARVLADYTATNGANYTFLLSVGFETIRPVTLLAENYQPTRIFYGDASCAPGDMWVLTPVVNPPPPIKVLGPLFADDVLIGLSFDSVWSVVRLTATVSGFVPYRDTGSDCVFDGGPALPLRRVELIEEGWLNSFQAPFELLEE